MKLILFLSVLFFSSILFAQEIFKIDASIPQTVINDDTKLTILNTRYGSRFSLSFVLRDNGVHVGSLGYDEDEFSELLLGAQLPEGNYCFKTGSLPKGFKYLLDQKVRVGLTSVQFTGRTDKGTELVATIVSSFTPSSDLHDTANIKTAIFPGFYIINQVISAKAISGKLITGIKKLITMPTDMLGAKFWMYGAKTDKLFFRDNADINSKNILATLRGNYLHYENSGYNGFVTDFNARPTIPAGDTLLYVAYNKGEVLYDNKYNLPLYFYYTHYWKNIFEVLDYAREQAKKNLQLSSLFEQLLIRSAISPKEKWLIAISFRSDIANTFFLTDRHNKARFYVAEGRFRHLSTVDVAYETELMALFTPWRLKIQLDMWMDYLATKEVDRGLTIYGHNHKEGMSASEYGPFIYHDVGDQPFVSITSDYWYGPQMAGEENSNYPLLLYWYWKLTGDDAFVKTQLGMVDVLLHSLINRDTDGNGIMDKGFGWSTFDNADVLKQSPENVYFGVKQLAAYLVSVDMFGSLINKNKGKAELIDIKDAVDGKDMGYETGEIANEQVRMKQVIRYTTEARKIKETLLNAFKKYGYLPCSLDTTYPGWNQYSVVINDGLWFPALTGFKSGILDSIMPALKATYILAVEKSRTDYGIKISSGEGGTWFSKIFVADIIASYFFGINGSSASYAYTWNKNNFYAYNDGINADGKSAWIGYWYPRGISSLGYIFRERNFTASQRIDFIKELKLAK